MGVHKFLTHPLTGETLTQQQWCDRLGISKKGLLWRRRKLPLEIALTLSRTSPEEWSEQEDELLLEVYAMPNLAEFWKIHAESEGLPFRSEKALDQRIIRLKARGKLNGSRRFLTPESGWLTMRRLAFFSGVGRSTIISKSNR